MWSFHNKTSQWPGKNESNWHGVAVGIFWHKGNICQPLGAAGQFFLRIVKCMHSPLTNDNVFTFWGHLHKLGETRAVLYYTE